MNLQVCSIELMEQNSMQSQQRPRITEHHEQLDKWQIKSLIWKTHDSAKRIGKDRLQIGTDKNTNNYHNTASVQTYNAQQVRQVQDMSETRLMEYHQEQYREQQRWLAYILMMQFFAKENMWSLLNQMRIHRTLDISA